MSVPLMERGRSFPPSVLSRLLDTTPTSLSASGQTELTWRDESHRIGLVDIVDALSNDFQDDFPMTQRDAN